MQRLIGYHYPHRRAFTLIEVITAMMILAVIAGAASLILGQLAVTYRDRALQGQLHVEASITLDRIAREIRDIESVQNQSGEYVPDISVATSASVVWESGHAIAFSGSTLTYSPGPASSPVLATDVLAFELVFQDENGSSLMSGSSVPSESLEDIRRVAIAVTIARSGSSDSLHTLIFIRSMMTTTDD